MMPTVAINTAQYMSLASYNGSYVVMMVDPDARTPQDPNLRFILHWLQPNFMLSRNTTSMNYPGTPLMNTTAAVVPYARPMPPPTSDAHRYILYAFQQPANFMVPSAFSGYSAMNRTNFNLTEFISAANLGTPAAANYFFCNNMTDVPQNFIALPGGTYPGGNGGAITDGPSGPATSTGGAATSASMTASTTGTAATSAAATTTDSSNLAGTTGVSPPGSGAAFAISVPGSTIAYLMAVIGAIAFYSI